MRILSREALCLDICKAGFSEQQLNTVRNTLPGVNQIQVNPRAGQGITSLEEVILVTGGIA